MEFGGEIGCMCDVVMCEIMHVGIQMRVRLESASWELGKWLKSMFMINDCSHPGVCIM